MRFMNDSEIDEALDRFGRHPILGAATQTLRNLRDLSNANGDGWPYWKQPINAANRLMELIEGDGTWESLHGDRDDATADKLKLAYRPIKAFLTRTKLACDLVDALMFCDDCEQEIGRNQGYVTSISLIGEGTTRLHHECKRARCSYCDGRGFVQETYKATSGPKCERCDGSGRSQAAA